MERFLKYLNSKFTITNEELEMVVAVCRIKKLRKKQYLLQEGDVWRYNAFVLKGFLRTYRVDNKGQEHYIQFSVEDWWAGDRESYIYEMPAKLNIDAFEDSEVLLISKDDFEMLLNKIPAFNTFMRDLMERSLIALRNRVHSNITFTAEEQYNDFLKTYPGSRVRNQVSKK